MAVNKIEEIIYAKESMEELKKTLRPYYVSEYGTKYQDLINERLQRTFF